MSPEALEAWRVLTAIVGRAAGAAAPEDLAEEAIRECQATVTRRRRREAIALSGRTRRARTSGGNLASRTRAWADASPLYARCLDLLTSGPEVISLRALELILQSNLFGGEAYLSQDPEKEQKISELLGAGFEAAPPHPIDNVEELDELIGTLREMFEEASADLLGQRPESGDPAADTWDQFAPSVRIALIRRLQTDIRAELA